MRSPTFLGGCWEPGCGQLNPREVGWMRCSRLALRKAGARLYEGTRVMRVSSARAGAIASTTAGGTVRPSKVVYATNGYTHLLPGMASKQMPAFAYIVVTEPLSPEQRAAIGWAGREGIEDGRNFMHFYRLTPRRPAAGRRRAGPGAVRRQHEPRCLAKGVGAPGAVHRRDISGAARHSASRIAGAAHSP